MNGHRLLTERDHPRGQMLVLFGVVMVLIIFAVGLVVDGGTGLAERRAAQNASDFAALAAARVIAEKVTGDAVNGTDANVQAAITNTVIANGGEAPTFGAPDGPRYVDQAGALLTYVGNGTIPANALGVKVSSERSWRPYFLGLFGISEWTAAADAVAQGGYDAGGTPPGNLFPAGIAKAFFDTYDFCSGDINTSNPSDPCYPQHLTPGNLNVPGGFGWLKFGCNGYGLGQDATVAGECGNSAVFLDSEIGPPGNSYGCCSQVGQGGPDRIGSLPGNKASADCDYYIDNEITVTVPIWDTAGGTGSNGWYHIIGFAGFQITECSGGKDIEGVWRKVFFTGPVTSTPPPAGTIGNPSVQLVN
jgi:hypothetical protein